MSWLLLLVLAAFPIAAADQPGPSADEVAAVLTNLAKMLELSGEIEDVAARGALPTAKETGAVAKVLGVLPKDLLDPWGTPYEIALGPGSHYSIVGAGSDRRFDRSTWNQAGQTTNSASDAVLRDGALTRSNDEWAEAQLARLHVDVFDALRRELAVRKSMRTMVNMGAIATALATYATDHQQLYPAGDLDSIARAVSPEYIRTLPRLDAWDNPIRVWVSPDRRSFRIVSAGSDKQFEGGLSKGAPVSHDSKADLVLTNIGWERKFESGMTPIEHAYGRWFLARSAAQQRALERRTPPGKE